MSKDPVLHEQSVQLIMSTARPIVVEDDEEAQLKDLQAALAM